MSLPLRLRSTSPAYSETAVSSITIPKPPGLAIADLRLVQIVCENDAVTDMTGPAGWTKLFVDRQTSLGTKQTMGAFWRLAAANDLTDPSPVFSFVSATSACVAAELAIVGADPTTPIHTFVHGTDGATSATHTTPSITTSITTLLVALFGGDGDNVYAPGGGLGTGRDRFQPSFIADLGVQMQEVIQSTLMLSTVEPSVAAGTFTRTATSGQTGMATVNALVAITPITPTPPTPPTPPIQPSTIYLAAKSNKPGSSLITLVDGNNPTGYRYMDFDVGSASWTKQYSGPRGTQGARLAGATPDNRLASWTLEAVGTTQDDLQAKLSVLWQLDEEFRRYGGTVTWRPNGGSFLMYVTVLDSGVQIARFDRLFVWNNRVQVILGVVSPPFMLGDPYDILDDFSTNSITAGYYTVDAGVSSDLSISAGVLSGVASLSAEKRLIHSVRSYTYGDHQTTLKATPGATIANFKAGVILKRIDANNYLEVYIQDVSATTQLVVDKVVAGTRTNLGTINQGARIVNGTPFWVRGRIVGNGVVIEYFTTAPTPMSTPTSTGSVTLTGGDIPLFGTDAEGQSGFSFVPQTAAATLDDFTVAPFTYRNQTLPLKISCNGVIPGDASALGTISLSVATGAPLMAWALFGWSQRCGATAPFGIIEGETGTSLANWAVTADANYRGGSGLKVTTGAITSVLAKWAVDPTALVPDDYRQNEIDIEVWARVEMASTLLAPTLALSVEFGTGGWPSYSSEYGAAGKPLTLPSSGTRFRMVRLGTVTMSTTAPATIRIDGTVGGASTGNFGLDYLVCCLARGRAVGPTGKPFSVAASPYPTFLGLDNSTKRILPDLAGRLRVGASLVDLPTTGLGGSLIEIPPGQVDLLVKPSSLVPDDPTADATTESLSQSATVQLSVTPRWRLARSS